MNTSRLYHFDVLKGMAIFAVVMGHILTMCVRDLDRAFIFKLIGQIHMPLFFFISGWLGAKAADGRLAAPRWGQRVRQLIVPMVVVSSLWIFYFPTTGLESPFTSTFQGLWTSEGKNGYWFTPVLFLIIAVQGLALVPLWNRLKHWTWRLGSIILITAILLAGTRFLPSLWVGTLSLESVATYFPVFALGAVLRQHSDAFARATASSWVQTAVICVGAVAFYLVSWYWEFPDCVGALMPVWTAVLHLCVAVVAIGAVAPWCARVFSPDGTCRSAWGRMWALLGRESLAIYLLHYFLLFPLGWSRPLLVDFHLALVPLGVFCALWAAAVIATVLGIRQIIALSKPLNLLFTGK